MSQNSKIALIRLDKIGDLCCTLPVDECLSNSDVIWIINQGLGFIPETSDSKRRYIELNMKSPWNSFWQLFSFLQKESFQTVILFHAPWWASFAAFLARIPQRVGPLSQWHSFLFLNTGVRQKRSASQQHEFDYNLDLVKKILPQLNAKDKNIFLKFKSLPGTEVLSQFHLQAKEYFVVHAGMSGSALNWPIEKYESLVQQLSQTYKVVMTGTTADDKYLKPLSHLKTQARVVWLQEQLNTQQLLTILSEARAVIGPSTGVMHLAAATGVPCLTLFSPIKVQSSTRWAPRSPKSKTISPEVACPAHFACLGEKCPYFYCMDKISVKQVYEEIQKIC